MDSFLHQRPFANHDHHGKSEPIESMRGCASKKKGYLGLFQPLSGVPVVCQFGQMLEPFVGESPSRWVHLQVTAQMASRKHDGGI